MPLHARQRCTWADARAARHIDCASGVVAPQAFWYKAALFSRALFLCLHGEAGKTLKKRGAVRQMTER
jgi:hypothetical protein